MSVHKKMMEAAAGNAGEAVYVDDVFSTYLYTGNGSTQTITNGIDLAGEGGMVWFKSRSNAVNNSIYDTEQGITANLTTDTTTGATNRGEITSFNSDGFTVPNNTVYGLTNASGYDYVSWTFRKAPKFFDVVTYTGTGSAQTIAHNLGAVPGMIIVKSTSNTSNWVVYHRSRGAGERGVLNSTVAFGASTVMWDSTEPTSTEFTVGTGDTNTSGYTFVAYLFAHNNNDGEFGENADQDIIKCGSFTTDGSGNADVTLGFEPQWILYKSSSSTSSWSMFDTMRGAPVGTGDARLLANASDAEQLITTLNVFDPTATGFSIRNQVISATYIYIAIRRPHKPAETGSEVFAVQDGGNGSFPYYTSNFPVDVAWIKDSTGGATVQSARLTQGRYVVSTTTGAEAAGADYVFDSNVGWSNTGSANEDSWMFKRSPGFFDVVCYTGTGSAKTVTHNLGVTPEIIMVRGRITGTNWSVYHKDLNVDADGLPETDVIRLNQTTAPFDDVTVWNDTAPTESVFTVGTGASNNSGETYIAYLFATQAGISKVGSYTGNGSTQTIDCGFSSGARFVLIRKSNTTGNWLLLDSARGIVAGNDPRYSIENTNAENTGFDLIDPNSSGFDLPVSTITNNSGDTYIYLAIA